MITNADLTIYNVRNNPRTRIPEYFMTQISGVHWCTDQKVQVDNKGLSSADVYKIRIPEDAETQGKQYVDPKQYAELEDVSSVWTIQNGDVFVKGHVDEVITKASEIMEKYPDISGRVISWSDNRFGGLPHFRIGGAG